MPSALVVGGVSWDTIVSLDRFPDPRPQTLFARASHETVGSTGAGKALNLARLGFEVTLHAVVGDDEPGRRARGRLGAAGVRVRHETDPAGTERHVNLMAADGGRISIYAAAGTFEPAIDLAGLEALLPAHDYLALNIVNYCRRLLPAAKRLGREVWCDVHDYDGRSPYHRDFLEAADYLFLSSDAMPDYRPFMERMVADGKRLVVCTHGQHGATALTPAGEWLEVPAVAAYEQVDTNGAGDAFFAGFLYGHARGYDLRRCLRVAAVVAGLCVASRELAHPHLSPERVERDYQAHFG
jgi:sugar/nucleoside kinase (ribokinase family)